MKLPPDVKLVAVSKYKPIADIMEAYEAGQRLFGENRPQEMAAKAAALPKDIEWHMIGHLQTNKVKMVVPYASLIHSVDSERLLAAIDSKSGELGKVMDVLLEIHVAEEETKSGLVPDEAVELAGRIGTYGNVRLRGIMSMATNTSDEAIVRRDFNLAAETLHKIMEAAPIPDPILSMGMTGDWPLAIECGSNMIRVGSGIFGPRNYNL